MARTKWGLRRSERWRKHSTPSKVFLTLALALMVLGVVSIPTFILLGIYVDAGLFLPCLMFSAWAVILPAVATAGEL